LLLRDTHASTADPEVRIYRKSANGALKLSCCAHVVSENRHGIIVASALSEATQKSERKQGAALIRRLRGRYPVRTVDGDTAYNERDFVEALQAMAAEPHVPADGIQRRDWVPAGVHETAGYRTSQKRRKWVERCFGWLKQVGGQRKTRFRGRRRVGWMFTFAAAAYNLVRIANLTANPRTA
jgi:hypothetical protein